MAQAATADGIDLAIASSYRDFASQTRIWRAKLNGERPVLDAQQQPVALMELSERERLYAILLYSALPGTSRHHWGTDLDIFDKQALPNGYRLQLTPDEYGPTGPFFQATCWLTTHAKRFGFFRPYRHFLGGVAPEPWHLSYRPLASPYLASLDTDKLLGVLKATNLLSPDLLEREIYEIIEKYVNNISDNEDE